MKEYVVYENPRAPVSTVEMFLDEIGIPIKIGTCGPGAGYSFHASLKGAESKKDKLDRFLTSTVGFGKTHKEACRDLLDSLKGRLLVIDSHGPNRKEIPVPYFSNIASFVEDFVEEEFQS